MREVFFLTGLPRSGTTWLADIVGNHSSVNFLSGEIFNPITTQSTFGLKNIPWLVNEDNLDIYTIDEIKKALLIRNNSFNFFFTRFNRLVQSKSYAIKDYLRLIKHLGYYFNDNPVFTKDPNGFFLSEFLIREFSAKVVVIQRNPYRWIGSMKRMNWLLDFNLIPSKYQIYFKEDIKNYYKNYPTGNLIVNNILWLKIFNYHLNELKKQNISVITVNHDDLTKNSEKEIKKVLEFYGLKIDKKIQDKIEFYNNQKSKKNQSHTKMHNLKRSVNEVMNLWNTQLDIKELKLIEKEINQLPPNLL